MIIRDFQKKDQPAIENVFKMYWTDPEFLKKLSDKLNNFINQSLDFIEKKYRFFVAEENNEIIGIAGMRSIPDHMKIFAKTDNPSELYIITSKYKGRGIGAELKSKIIEENKTLGFSEIILYSPDSHKESWGFYDNNGFERVGEAVAPDGEPGQIWRMVL